MPARQPIWPDYDQVCGVLYELAEGLFGGADHSFPTFGVRDSGLLESAIALPHQTSWYYSFFDGLAAMVRSIAENHALLDGNKRLAVAVLHGTLLVNGYGFIWSDDDVALLIERCAKREVTYREISLFIETWSAPIIQPHLISERLWNADLIADVIAIFRRDFATAVETDDPARDLVSLISRHAAGLCDDHDERSLATLLREVRRRHGRMGYGHGETKRGRRSPASHRERLASVARASR